MTRINPQNCKITPCSETECAQYLELARNDGYKWFLAFVKAGILWGIYDESISRWKTSDSALETELKANLINIRFFSQNSELMIWKNEDAITGRKIDDSEIADHKSPLIPQLEERILFGEHFVANHDGSFTQVADKKGSEQIIPVFCSKDDFNKAARGDKPPFRLLVKNYFGQCTESGQVRNVLSRLVEVKLGV